MKVKKYFKKLKLDLPPIKVKKLWQKKKVRRVVLITGLSILTIAALFFSFNLAYQGKIFPRTYIGSVNYGGLHTKEAQNLLEDQINQNKSAQITYTYNGKTYTLEPKTLEVNYQKEETVKHLMAIGRTGSLGEIIKANLKSVFTKNRVIASYTYKESILTDYLREIAKDIDKPEKDATIEIKDGNPQVLKEEIGQKFDLNLNQKIALETIGSFNLAKPVPFEISKVIPKINQQGAEAAIPETKRLLKRQLSIKANDKDFEIKPEDMADLLEFVARPNNQSPQKGKSRSAYVLLAEVSPSKIGALVDGYATGVYQEPKDPQFKVSGRQVVAFQIAQTGYELDKVKATSEIVQALKSDVNSLELTVKVTEPTIASDNPEEIGLKELIGEGSTSWRGSPSNRIHNLTLGSEKISGTIVKPGEEFSTIKTIGQIDASTGFLQELVIKNSTQVVPEYGGGLCQVSTTLFRAVLNSGLKVTARTAHSFRVSYYEPPVGMDATIYDPAPDFRFINNMSTPILVWATATQNGLNFQIYGTKDARKIEVSEPEVGSYISPPAPVYTLTETMEAGDIRQVERATPGATASFHYKVTASNGEVLENDTFTSKYVALPDSYLYGPGTPDIPTPAPETPEAP